MAEITRMSPSKSLLVLTRKEAADIVALLAGQLAGTPVAGAMGGAAPSVVFYEGGKGVEFVFSVAPESKDQP